MGLGARTVALTCSLVHSCSARSARLGGRNAGHPDALGGRPAGPGATPNELRARSSGMFSHLVTRVGDAIQGPVPRGRPVGMCRRPWSVLPAEFTRWTSWLVTRAAVPGAHSVRSPGSDDPLGKHFRQRGCTVRRDTGLWFTGLPPRRRDHGRPAVAEACRHGSSCEKSPTRGGFSHEMAQFSRERSIETAWRVCHLIVQWRRCFLVCWLARPAECASRGCQENHVGVREPATRASRASPVSFHRCRVFVTRTSLVAGLFRGAPHTHRPVAGQRVRRSVPLVARGIGGKALVDLE